MRLLEVHENGILTFTKDLPDRQIPSYAILSHTWNQDSDEVVYQDILNDRAKDKIGYKKIKFCATQAGKDGLRHIWVDSCCIDRTNSAELSEAINSMFRWYAKSEKCYVFLSDVTGKNLNEEDKDLADWERQLRLSRWFTRGWTLQELLAPSVVEFFSSEGKKLGDRISLGRLISNVTLLPTAALRQEVPLEDFTIAERLTWQERRETTKDEDMAYSLFGICGVSLAVIYGEGKENAFRRLRSEIDSVSKGGLVFFCDHSCLEDSFSEAER